MNNVMLRFRPIAPKPVSGGTVDSKNLVVLKGRTKRKYVRVRRNRRSKKELSGEDRTVVTLQLLPGKVDQEEEGTVRTGLGLGVVLQEDPPTWREADRTVETLVTVECVTDSTVMGAGGVRYTEMERDTCPVMISEGLNKIVWVNGAFRRMVKQENGKQEVRVGLVVKEKVPSGGGFSCRVRVQYKMKVDQWSQMVMPCDVWRINGGGFAWRLDIEAALSLGR